MKKSSEDLSRLQEQTDYRRALLESGGIRLIKERPQPTPKQKDEELKTEK